MSIFDLQTKISEKFTEDILLDILRRKSDCKDVIIRAITLGPPTKKGDSYLSTVTKFSVRATGQDERSGDNKDFEEHIIVKSIPKNVARRKTFRSIDFFTNEIAFYNKVWPALDNFQRSKNLKKPFESVPQCLHTFANGTDDFIVLEDVSVQGYCDLGRAGGLDVDEAKVIIRVFARFHALSLAFKDQHPTEFENIASSIQETYFAEKFRSWSKANVQNLFNVATDAIEKQLPESYLKKINEYSPDELFRKASQLCATHGKLSVITHGDCWIPNYLVKFDETGVNAVNSIMIDYQIVRYSSLSLDVLFFFFGCLKPATVREHWDDLLKEYHGTLVGFLKDLGSSEDLLTLQLLNEELRLNGAFGFIASLETIVLSLLDDDEVADIDTIQGDEAVPLDSVWIIRPFQSEKKRKQVAEFFKYLVDNHFI